jgi:hypothetical protein
VATAPVEQRVRQLVTILRAPDLYVVKSSQVQYREYKDWTGDPMHSTECEDSTASLPRETRERLLRLRTDKARGSVDQLHPLIVLLLLLLLLFLLLLLLLLLPLLLLLLLLPLLLLCRGGGSLLSADPFRAARLPSHVIIFVTHKEARRRAPHRNHNPSKPPGNQRNAPESRTISAH